MLNVVGKNKIQYNISKLKYLVGTFHNKKDEFEVKTY
jgi:hypothetical protein